MQPSLLAILAPPRCYTTLVSAMIGQHPQMYGLPETYLFTSRTMTEWWVAHQGSDRKDGLLRAVAQIIFGGQTPRNVRLAWGWLRRPGLSTTDVLRDLASKVAPLILVEKTPQAAERIEYMRHMNAEFPAARFLHLLRHPLSHVLSRLERRLEHLRKTEPLIDLAEVAQRFGGADPQMLWYRCNTNIVSFLESISPERKMRVRTEALLSDPDTQLREIAKWLHFRFDSAAIDAMKHPERSPYACFGPPNARMGGDENFFKQPVLRPFHAVSRSLDDPLPWRLDGKGFRPVIRELAKSFGYD